MTRALRVTNPDSQTIPRGFAVALYAFLLIAGAVSVPFIGVFGPLPTTVALDVWIVSFTAYCLVRGRTETWLAFWLLIVYGATRVIPAYVIDAPLFDFAQAYRWVLYLMVFVLAVGRVWPGIRWVVITTWALNSMAFVKAALTFVVLGPGERPGLLLENNFELALFSGLVAVIYRHLRSVERFGLMLLLGGLTVLSGSRSGAIAFVVLAIFAVAQTRSQARAQTSRASLFLFYMGALAVVIAGFIAVLVFQSRITPSGVDRLRFFNVLMSETADWGILNWLFGTVPITPLSYSACSELVYYQSLFSSLDDGTCYSVIFHAFNMRVLFDAGLFGLALSLGVTWYAMRKAKVETGVALTLMGIAFTNGFSVSGINNPYVGLPIILAITTASIHSMRSSAGSLPDFELSGQRARSIPGSGLAKRGQREGAKKSGNLRSSTDQ